MKKTVLQLLALFILAACFSQAAFSQSATLKIVIIRHGEKPKEGDNLTCKGLNRALQLPKVLYKKFGIPAYTYVPALLDSAATKHARMFQTVTPFAVRYNLVINSSLAGKDYNAIATELKRRSGTVLLVWDHKAIAGIAQKLGVKGPLSWSDDDFDSIWIITFNHGVATLRKDKEALNPGPDCP